MDVIELASKLGSLNSMLFTLLEDIEAQGIDGGPEELAEAVSEFHAFVDKAKEVYSVFSSDVINRIEFTPDPLPTSNGGTVEVLQGSSRKKWDHARAARDVATRIHDMSIDMETGERTMTPEDMIQELVQYAGIGYWKVGALKKLDLTADNYCEVTEGSKNLVVRGPKT
jgi:hypothetical protein